MPSITVVSGPNEGDYYPLGKRTMVIGRGEVCPIQIVDDLISRRHLQIRYDSEDRQYHAYDMKSSNGVYINGHKIESETILHDNDVIDIGRSKLMFSLQEFDDRESAMNNYKQRGQRGKSTLLRPSWESNQ